MMVWFIVDHLRGRQRSGIDKSSTTSDPEHHIGKLQNKRKHNTQESQEVSM